MTAIIVENGSIVANANSYVTMVEYIAYAASLNITVQDTSVFQAQIISAAQFIDGLEKVLKGNTVSRSQPLAFPRNNLTDIANWSWSGTEIPYTVKQAQMSLALDIQSGEDLWNLSQDTNVGVKEEAVIGAVLVKYAIADAQSQSRRSRSANLLSLLMKYNGVGIPLIMS